MIKFAFYLLSFHIFMLSPLLIRYVFIAYIGGRAGERTGIRIDVDG